MTSQVKDEAASSVASRVVRGAGKGILASVSLVFLMILDAIVSSWTSSAHGSSFTGEFLPLGEATGSRKLYAILTALGVVAAAVLIGGAVSGVEGAVVSGLVAYFIGCMCGGVVYELSGESGSKVTAPAEAADSYWMEAEPPSPPASKPAVASPTTRSPAVAARTEKAPPDLATPQVITCPSCGARLRSKRSFTDRSVTCPRCQSTFLLAVPEAPAPAAPSGSPGRAAAAQPRKPVGAPVSPPSEPDQRARAD